MEWGERYDSVTEILESVGAHMDAAESHGTLCGMLSGPKGAERAEWMAEVLADTEPRGEAARACLEALSMLFDETASWLADDSFGFDPLLPEDEVPLPVRARALAGWCQGFLYGLARTGPDADADLPPESREALSDMAEIARVAAAPDEDEDDEESYAELVEYVRVAVMLYREHVQRSRPLGEE